MMNSYIGNSSTGFFNVQQQSMNIGGGNLLSSSTSTNVLPTTIAELRRKRQVRSTLVGGSNMASANPNDQRMKLERVIGMTVNSVAALACDPVNGLIAYPAGSTIVLYSPKRNRQAHIINPARKNITCVSFSPDGMYLAAAECGHQPAVRVWDVEERTQIVELQGGHNFGISCLMFSPDMKYLISVGNQHDNVVNVWNWKNQRKSSTNKVSCKVKAISFAEDGSYFVTVGVRHVKFWYLERSKTATPKYQDTVPLQGRSAILADQRNNYFCDVACGKGSMASKTFAITQSGLLCEFNSKRLLEKWLDLKTRCAYSISISTDHVFVGCAEGTVHVFKCSGLSYIATLPRPHYLGVDVASAPLTSQKYAKYPDVMALRYDENRKKLSCIYNDHSLYQWTIGDDFKQLGKTYSSLGHGGCIWSIEMYPTSAQLLPPGTFFTGSSDDTVRVWNIDPNMPVDTTVIGRNIYSQELLKIVYADAQLAHLCDSELAVEKQDNQYDGKSGIRALKTSPDGRHLASGDRSGNLRIYSMTDFTLLYQLSAHDSEVLCLEYSTPKIGSYFLASSSRDRLLHVLDPTRNYEPVCTIDDHSSSITSVKFARGLFNSIRTGQPSQELVSEDDQDDLIMLSGGADKSIIIRKMVQDPQGQQQFVRANYVALQSTVYDMDVDHRRNTVLAACQDRQIRAYQIADGKFDRAFKGSSNDDIGTLIKLELDPSCTFVATSTSDKQTYIIDARNGELIASMGGHGELVTGLKFSNDCRHLITVSGDGCIFVWRLSTELTNRMLSRLTRLTKATSDVSVADVKIGDDHLSSGTDDRQIQSSDVEADLQLPSWAKRKTESSAGETSDDNYQYKPRGRWAKRPEPIGLESNDGYASSQGSTAQQQSDQDFVAPAGSVQKILKQFEGDRSDARKGRHEGDFGSLANVRLIGTDEEDGKKKEEMIYYPPSAAGTDPNLARDFVVTERSAMGSKPYRGAETMGDMSDEESGTASSVEMASSSMRMSESVGELHPRQHRMVVDAFEKIETPDQSSDHRDHDQTLERGTPGRQSITSRYLQRSGAATPTTVAESETTTAAQPAARSRWNMNHTPVVPARILITPATMTPSPKSTPESGNSKRLSTNQPSPLVNEETVTRAKQLSEAAQRINNRDRRQTFTAFDRTALSTTPKRVVADRGDDGDVDYASSELHQRSRSRSRGCISPPRQPGTGAMISRTQSRRESEDSEFSPSGYRQKRKPTASYFGFTSKLITSRSMTSLLPSHHASSPTSTTSAFQYQNHSEQSGAQNQGGGAMKRLNDIREKLRKSQENIAFAGTGAVSGTTTPTPDYGTTWEEHDRSINGTRSKSYGNLVFASGLDAPQRKHSTPIKEENGGRSRLSSLLQSRGIALSTGNLGDPNAQDGDNNRQRTPNTGGTASNLVGAILDFKKRSATDLSQATLTNEDRSDSVVGSFYEKVSTMPRRHQHSGASKKAQAIRSQRFTTTSTTDRMSVSGESEDSSLDFYNPRSTSANTSVSAMTRSQIITPSMRQRLDMVGDANSSRSSSPSVNMQQQQQKAYDIAKQIFETKQRQSQKQLATASPGLKTASRPVSNYLAKILNASEDHEQDNNSQSSPSGNQYFTTGGRHQSEGSLGGKRMSTSMSSSGHGQDRLSSIVDSCDNHFDKMSGHCKDSVSQFRTSLDKVLQAYNMVIDDTDLTEAERDELLRTLSVELEAARERLNHALTQQRSAVALAAARRHEPEGGRDERLAMMAGIGTRRHQQSTQQGPIQHPTVAGPAISPSGSELDTSLILQEYSDKLVSLIQKKMHSSAGK